MFGSRLVRWAAGLFAASAVASLMVVHLAAAQAPSETVRVEAQDTVWGIAERRYPEADTRAKVDEILRLNGRRDPVIHPGETLKVPSR
jgi:LysM repeat protein